MQDLILILSYHEDRPAVEVFQAMQRRGLSALLIDPGDFPQRLALDASFDGEAWQGALLSAGERIPLGRIKSIFYRRPTHYVVDPALPSTVQAFAENEAAKGFGGILRSLDCFWVSHPDALRAAAFKPRQLKVAASLGLRTPSSLVTNDAAAVRRFYHACEGNIIYKTLHGGNIAAGPDEYDAIYTSAVTEESLAHLDRVKYTAHIFQQRIEKAFELRINVIGERVFAAAIYAPANSAARIDFRAAYDDLRYEVYALPDAIVQKCRRLVKQFGLQYGAIDMAVWIPKAILTFSFRRKDPAIRRWLLTRHSPSPARIIALILSSGGRCVLHGPLSPAPRRAAAGRSYLYGKGRLPLTDLQSREKRAEVLNDLVETFIALLNRSWPVQSGGLPAALYACVVWTAE